MLTGTADPVDAGEPLTKRKNIALYVLMVLPSLVLYGRSIRFPLINYDDFIYLNPDVTSGSFFHSLGFALTSRVNYYSPVTWISYILDSFLYSTSSPGTFRVTNICLHIANTVLAFNLVTRVFPNSKLLRWVPVVFAIHPVQVESVVWVSERKGLLAAFFVLLFFNEYLSWLKTGKTAGAVRMALFFLLSALSKPALLLAPFLLPVLRAEVESIPSQRSKSVRTYRTEALLMASAILLVVAHVILQEGTLATKGSLNPRIATSACSYLIYLAKVCFPADLIIPYQRYQWSFAPGVFASGIIVVITFSCFALRKKHRGVLFGWLWYLVLLFPASGITPLGETGLANRYLYLPILGVLLVIGILLESWSRETPSLWNYILAGALGLCICATTWRDVSVWHDTASLFGRTVRLDSSNALAKDILYREALRVGEPAKAEMYFNVAQTNVYRSVFGAYFIKIR
ncbi:MAG TPA: hypothetical protein VG938_02515 [Verrucomicrobiae bacterium]|nr:hypothetical protein [Verrucomicrobiae bacterium]